MGDQIRHIDLTNQLPARVPGAVLHALQALARGEAVEFLTAVDPAHAMAVANLQWRDMLAWETRTAGRGRWRTVVRRREDVAPSDAVDVLMRDHKRLDALFAHALQSVNEGRMRQTAADLQGFAEGLRRHIHVENDVLHPLFSRPQGSPEAESAVAMLREHEEILAQTALLEDFFASGLPRAQEVAAFFAILSGLLAKHEHREEIGLFPYWRAAISHAPTAVGAHLLATAREAVEGRASAKEGDADEDR
ncbi:MAG: hemerythrin domain-containing protein [Betaproteobacteria bacterium]|nr:hemerythrin domain-containing protein [Betaproteobacteria bacterium]